MLKLENERVLLTMDEDGSNLVILDKLRRQRWRLDESTRYTAGGPGRGRFFDDIQPSRLASSGIANIGPAQCRQQGGGSIVCAHRGPAGAVELEWILGADGLRLVATAPNEGGVANLALPGAFEPVDDAGHVQPFVSAVPECQGLLHTGKGKSFCRTLGSNHGHISGLNMDMFGQLSPRGGLLVIGETPTDATLLWEKTHEGRMRLAWLQGESFGRLSYPRETVLLLTPPDLTALCKSYRRYEMGNGRFKSWQEKIAQRPALEKLFGAAMVYIGYLRDDKCDYAASFRRLKQRGIDSAYVYPMYMASTFDSPMQQPWLDLREMMPLLQELGYLGGSFIYITDGQARPGEQGRGDLNLDADGKPRLAWQIDDQSWYVLSAGRQMELARESIEREHRVLDGVHYDVLCSALPFTNHNPACPTDLPADMANRAAMLDHAGSKGLIISSEGFWGRMTPHYDIGSVKYSHILGGDEYCVVPMTMLVYHDSAIHSWWEVDNYNNYEHRSQWGRGQKPRNWLGGGAPATQSAIDALMGLPPDIMPFGLQYNFVPHSHPRSYVYRFQIDDPLVRESIERAKPVMALHKRVGKLELLEHRLLRSDGALQESIFVDGTRVVANFANVATEAPGLGLIEGESWRVV